MNKMFFAPFVGLVSSLLVYASCVTTEGVMSELDGEWEVVTVTMDSTVLDLNGLAADVDPYFGFDVSQDRFYGNTAYNAVSGNLVADSLDNGNLSIYHIASTMKANPTMNLERSIVDNLEKVKRYESYGTGADTLEFFDENGKTLFTLARRAPYSRLKGKWQVAKAKGKRIEPETAETMPYVVFDISHNVKMIFGYTGCNAFNGSVCLEVGNDKIHFGEVAVAGRVCEDIVWENDMLSAFREADTYEVADGVMLIFNAKGDEILRLHQMR